MYGKNNTYLHLPQTPQHNEIHDLLAAHNYLVATNNNTQILEGQAAAALYNDFNHLDVVSGQLNGVVLDHSTTMVNGFPKKQPAAPAAKKDRHSKIYTVHGPRDRRVRLSIGIARKFFDLQEMLNFDKPSKTLDWLLTKSKEAIKDLVKSKSGKSATSSDSEVEVGDVANCENGNSSSLKGKSVVVNSSKCKGVVKDSITKESRVKARARARERTKEKMCIKAQLNEANRNNFKGCSWSSNTQVQFDDQGPNNILHCPMTSNYEDLIQESVVIKKKMKQYTPMFGFHQQNLTSSNDTENWDYNNFASQSNQLCNMLDHHKFIN